MIYIDFNNALIIITGVSGSGKTTLARELSYMTNIDMLSVDDFKVREYQSYFYNDYERNILRTLALDKFKVEVIRELRSAVPVIVEYAFKEEWNDFFSPICQIYNYERIVVNCNTLDFDIIWNRRVQRDMSDERQFCLKCSSYTYSGYTIDNNRFSNDRYVLRRSEYYAGVYNRILGGYEYSDVEFRSLIGL